VQWWLDVQPQTFFERAVIKLTKWWWQCVEVEGEYVEKYVLQLW
jgi:hypothetical protein